MDDIDIDKISRVLVQPIKELALKVHIKLLREKEGRKENFHNLYAIEGKKYLKIDLQSFLTLEILGGEWAKDKSILIDQKNIFHVIKGLEKLLDNIYNGNIFAMNKKKEVVIYKDEVEKNTVRLYNIGGNQKMIAAPAVIYDENEVSYEGVVLYFNKTENYVQLPIDAFETLVYTLKKVDLFVYSQQLLNYYISCIKDEKVELKEVDMNDKKPVARRRSIFDDAAEEEVKSTLVKEESAEDFFNFKEV